MTGIFEDSSIKIDQFVFTKWDSDSSTEIEAIESGLDSGIDLLIDISEDTAEEWTDETYAFININSVDSFSGIDELFVNHSNVTELESDSYSFLVVVRGRQKFRFLINP